MSIDKDQIVTLFRSKNMDATVSEIIVPDDSVYQASIIAHTDSTFNGTTSTLSLKVSNDNINYAQAYADDDTTPLTFTLSASSNYSFLLKKVLFRYYKLTYTIGDASAGILDATFIGKKA